MIYVIKYKARLGDIVRCLPIAKHMSSRGATVYFWCEVKYHSIFECIDYCTPVDDGAIAALHAGDEEVRVLDYEVYPHRMDEYRASGLGWDRFVFDLHEESRGIPVVKPYMYTPFGSNNAYDLVSPFGVSQHRKVNPQDVVSWAVKTVPSERGLLVLTPPWEETLPGYAATTFATSELHHMVALIAGAVNFTTVNTSTSPIAAAVRQGYTHVYSGDECDNQDDYFHKMQTRVKMKGHV